MSRLVREAAVWVLLRMRGAMLNDAEAAEWAAEWLAGLARRIRGRG